MADAQKTIDLIFNGVDKTGVATQAALSNLASFSTGVGNVAQPIADFTIGAAKLEAAILASGLAVTTFAVKVAGDFEGAFKQLSTLFDASAAEMATYKDQVRDYASQSSRSMADVMASLQAAVGAGVDYKDSIGLISIAEKLAIATKSDMKAATEVLVSTLNSFGMSTKDAGAMADLLFQIIKDGKIEMHDLSQSLAQVTPLAAAAGIGMKEVGAAIAVLTAAGMQPSTAIEALRSAISNIIKPSAQAKTEAEALGIGFDASALKAKGLSGVLDDVAKATGGSTEKMALLFGDVTGLTAALALTGPQAEKFKAGIDSMGASAGSVSGAYDKMAGSMENTMQRMTNAFQDLMVAIGTPLLDQFGGVAGAITAIFKTIAASVRDGGLKDLTGYIESQFKDLEKTFQTVAGNLPAALAKADFSSFAKAVDVVIKAVEHLFGGADLTSADGLKRIIETAGLAFLGLSNYVAGTIEGFKPLLDMMVKMGSKADEGNTAWLKWAGGMGTWAIEAAKVAPIFSTIFTGIAALSAVNFTALAANMGLLATAAAPLAFAAALTGLAFEAYKTQTAIMELIAAKEKLAVSTAQGVKIQDRATLSLDDFAKSSGIVVKSIDEASKLIDNGTVVWSSAINGWVKAGSALADVAAASSNAQAEFRKSEITLENQASASGNAAGAITKLGGATSDASKYVLKTVPIYDAVTGAITGYEEQLVKADAATGKFGDATAKANTPLTKTAAEISKAEDSTRKWNEEVAKMAFTEKLHLIDAATKITVANIESFAKLGIAAFDSVNTSIKSTGDLIGKLFGDIKGADRMTQIDISHQIDKENQARDDAFKLQKALVESQIDYMRAQTNAMNNGDGMIKIDGAGLQPHLEAFMWEILRTIQVKVNNDGLKMLLGV